MEILGKITKINSELEYGFVTAPKVGEIFFSNETHFSNTSFSSLSIGQKVTVKISETARGLFATSFSIQESSREASL